MFNYNRDYFQRRLSELKNDRLAYENIWEDINKYVYPLTSGNLTTPTPFDQRKNRDKYKHIINDIPLKSVITLATGMQGGLTSPARKWFKIGTEQNELEDNQNVKDYLYHIEKLMYTVLAKTNFYETMLSTYAHLSSYSTHTFEVVEDEEFVAVFREFEIGQYYLGVDFKGEVDTCYREFNMTASQMIDEFGYENCSHYIQNAYDANLQETTVVVVHAIERNRNFNKGDFDRRFLSAYYEKDTREVEQPFLRFNTRGTYDEFPLIVSNWSKVYNSAYGDDSPGFMSKGNCKMLQAQEKDIMRAIQLGIAPPLQTAGDIKRVNLSPLGITQIAGTDNTLLPIYNVNLRIADADAKKQQTEQAIRESFYNHLFLLISGETKDMTATETSIRDEEKKLMLGNVVERIEVMLNLTLTKIYNIMNDRGMFMEPPEELAGQELKIKYISLLSQAQKMGGLNGLVNFVSFVAQTAQVNPEVLDKVNLDESVEEYADIVGIPPELLKSDKEVIQIRDLRRDQMNRLQQSEQMERMVNGVKTLSDAKTSDPSVLTAISEGMRV